uniref:Uncharacterized protein n=1 Tax=Anguilla anguilla TaxID=7936 RepID=A0A0E9VTN0_ANGAN
MIKMVKKKLLFFFRSFLTFDNYCFCL